MKASEWAFDRIKEAFEKVAQDEAEKVRIVQEIVFEKHGLLAAHHRASWRTRRSHNVLLVPALQQFPIVRLRLVGLWVKNIPGVGAQFVGRSTIGSNPTGFWSCKQVRVLSRPRSSKHMQYLRACAKI